MKRSRLIVRNLTRGTSAVADLPSQDIVDIQYNLNFSKRTLKIYPQYIHKIIILSRTSSVLFVPYFDPFVLTVFTWPAFFKVSLKKGQHFVRQCRAEHWQKIYSPSMLDIALFTLFSSCLGHSLKRKMIFRVLIRSYLTERSICHAVTAWRRGYGIWMKRSVSPKLKRLLWSGLW